MFRIILILGVPDHVASGFERNITLYHQNLISSIGFDLVLRSISASFPITQVETNILTSVATIPSIVPPNTYQLELSYGGLVQTAINIDVYGIRHLFCLIYSM